MLHGGHQDPHAFAVATGMNQLAREQGFLVLYPELSQPSTPDTDWHWFERGNQARGSGESAQIAALTLDIAARNQVDPDRIYIAGLSAGAAMAASVAAAYPELYAAVGVHAGMPSRLAINLAEALAVQQQSTAEGLSLLARLSRADLAPSAGVVTAVPVPTIVFHAEQADPHIAGTDLGVVERTRFRGSPRPVPADSPAHHDLAEHSLVHGNGAAWAGGRGPQAVAGDAADVAGRLGLAASAEMLLFFFAQPGPPRPCAASVQVSQR
jgi:poly(hydroxyalkanoate) depolymerase family esterase